MKPETRQPLLGAWPEDGGTRFRVWAPAASRVHLVLERTPGEHALEPDGPGTWTTVVPGAGPGTRYRYRLDDSDPMPDPASRFQPLGVHGPSEVVAPDVFEWSDREWAGIPHERLVFYELHVGTFTEAGTFRAAAERLSYLVDLGVTAVEMMPVAECPGTRNWGYDGASLFAPFHAYGHPDDLRFFVNEAHAAGLAVVLDVVYNHLGPDGAYLPAFAPVFFSSAHQSPWGDAVNLDQAGSEMVRTFLVENALYWLSEFHFDGLRLDATHAMVDEGPRHFLVEVAGGVHSLGGFRRFVFAEDERNLAYMVKPVEQGGFGLDGVWADDFHHEVHTLLTGESDGYYADYSGRAADLARTIRDGWFYQGQHSRHLGRPRGTPPEGIEPKRLVICLQNHDQVGNRALGERLNHLVDAARIRAATVLLLLAPQTPLIFMGQEWAASTPFLYFTDHNEELGRLVTEGRRREFRKFQAFSDPGKREKIPDPQARSTFDASKLRWEESTEEPRAAMLRLYRTLLLLRARDEALMAGEGAGYGVEALDDHTILLWRGGPEDRAVAALVRLGGGEEEITIRPESLPRAARGAPGGRSGKWKLLLSTEDPLYSPDPRPPLVTVSDDRVRVRFARPSAVVLKRDG